MKKERKASVLLFILALSMLLIVPTAIEAKIEKTDPVETNSGVGRPYQDIVGLDAHSNGTHLSINVTLNQGPPKADNETHINIYLTFDTAPGGQEWFPDYTDARYTNPADFWEWCLALYSWTNETIPSGTNTGVDLINPSYVHTDAIAAGVTVTNSTDGTIVMMEIPLSVIGSPSNVTIGVITHEDGAHVFKDTIGSGTVHLGVDGIIWGQWIEVQPAIVDLPTGASNSASASDPTNDFVIKAFNDITKVEVGAEELKVIVNVTFANVSGMDNTWIYDEQWDLSIALDTDHSATDANQTWIMGVNDVRIDLTANDTFWERCIVLDSLTSIQYYDEDQNSLGASGITATLLETEHKVKVSIPMALIPFGEDRKLNLTVVSSMDNGGLFCDVVGTWSYTYDPNVNTQGYYLVHTSIPSTEAMVPPWPGPAVPTPPDVIGRPYQDIVEVRAHSNGTTLNLNVTLNDGPPKADKEKHVNIYVAIDTADGGNKWFPDSIDAGYNNSAYFWEYCLALYNWTGAVQDVDLIYDNWTHTDALALGVTVTNSSSGETVIIDIPLSTIGGPSTVTLGVVTSEDFAKIRDTVGTGTVRLSEVQWVQVEPFTIDLPTGASNSASASDPTNDFVGKAFWDITEVTAGQQGIYVIVNVTFLEVTGLSWSTNEWRLSIGIDTDHQANDLNQTWMAFIGDSDTRIDLTANDTFWERCIVLDSPTDIHLYDEEFNDYGASGITATLIEEEDKIMISIPQCSLPPSSDQKLNLTVISGMDGGSTVYDVLGTYTYIYDPAVNTQGYYLITTSIPSTGPVMYPFPLPSITFNNATGRPYQDITGVDANMNATHLNIDVKLNQAPPKQDNETHVNIYVAIDTADGGNSWFPDDIDARYSLTAPEHYWEYCLALYSWTGLPQHIDLFNATFARTNATTLGVTVTNSTDGKTVTINIPLSTIGNPSTVTLGVVTSEDFAKIRDTVGTGIARPVCWQWVEIEPAITDLSSSASVSDPTKDFVGKAYWDITYVKFAAVGPNIVVNVTFADVTGLQWSWDQWRLSIGIDTDQVENSTEPWMGFIGEADTRIDPAANQTYWERCVALDSPTDIHLYNVVNATWYDLGASGITATLIEEENKVMVSIPRDSLPPPISGRLTLTIISGTDDGNTVYDVYGDYTYTYDPNINTQGFHLITAASRTIGKLIADINDDGEVDIGDIVLCAIAFGSTPAYPNWNPIADVNTPYGEIDIGDIVFIAIYFGQKQ